MKNHEEHLVISIAKLEEGIDLREDVKGTLPELSSLLSLYLVHFAQMFSKKEITKDGAKIDAKTILKGILTASMINVDRPLPMEELDEE